MSKIKVNSIEAATGSTVTLPSGQTLDLSSGTVTLPNSSVNLTTKVTGTLPVANGGTGLTTLGSASQVLRVNSGATALEFATAPSGKVLQVVQTIKTDFFSSSSGSYTDVTGASVSITPSSASNKVLIIINGEYGSNNNDGFGFLKVLRDSTDLSVGDLRGSEQRATMSAALRNGGGASDNVSRSFSCTILDSPNKTSSTTYKIQLKSTFGTTCIGGSSSTSDANRSSVPTFLTAMEIAG
jgi:hypothetical protein